VSFKKKKKLKKEKEKEKRNDRITRYTHKSLVTLVDGILQRNGFFLWYKFS